MVVITEVPAFMPLRNRLAQLHVTALAADKYRPVHVLAPGKMLS